jgi:hypothetical protein
MRERIIYGIMGLCGTWLLILHLVARSRIDGNRLELRTAKGSLALRLTQSGSP